jgi:hypothetical protein
MEGIAYGDACSVVMDTVDSDYDYINDLHSDEANFCFDIFQIMLLTETDVVCSCDMDMSKLFQVDSEDISPAKEQRAASHPSRRFKANIKKFSAIWLMFLIITLKPVSPPSQWNEH